MDLIEAEDIKKRWQEYTEELCKKGLNDPDNHDGVVTNLEPGILECVFLFCYIHLFSPISLHCSLKVFFSLLAILWGNKIK